MNTLKTLLIVVLLGRCTAVATGQSHSTAPTLRTASHHPMQYYISLPSEWTPTKTWPVVVTVTGGLKNFQENAQLFADARKNLSFIIVTPINLTNGGKNLRTLPEYQYAPAVWDEVDRTGWCDFDLKGLESVIDDVRTQYHGTDKYFIAGHSAGGHLVWMMVFAHPEKLLAAATTGGNFTNRCIEHISQAPERRALPIKGFRGDKEPEASTPDKEQFFVAKSLAHANGYENVSYEVVKGENYNAMPAIVLAYFSSLLDNQSSR